VVHFVTVALFDFVTVAERGHEQDLDGKIGVGGLFQGEGHRAEIRTRPHKFGKAQGGPVAGLGQGAYVREKRLNQFHHLKLCPHSLTGRKPAWMLGSAVLSSVSQCFCVSAAWKNGKRWPAGASCCPLFHFQNLAGLASVEVVAPPLH
jgi:hypothetical protein